MSSMQTYMRQEIDEIPHAVERLLTQGSDQVARAVAALAQSDPRFVATVARGSSDHACSYFKYICEISYGLPVASIGPSVASIYQAPLALKDQWCLAVSQSGQSPDIVAMAQMAAQSGAVVTGFSNTKETPLERVCDAMIDIAAGPEKSVAATKTFVASIVAALWVLGQWRQDTALLSAIHRLPELLAKAAAEDWPQLQEALVGRSASAFTLGRGPSWAISNEAALKFKETCQIHAESYSAAEVMHGPVEVVGEGFPILAFAAQDQGGASLIEIVDQLSQNGAQCFVTSTRARHAQGLPAVRTGHYATDPLMLIVSFYAMVEGLARKRGLNPDAPRNLKKVTETV